FEQFSFISSEDLPEFQSLLARIGREGTDAIRPEDRTMLLSLPFKISPARHRLGIIDDDMRSRLLAARRAFAANLPERYTGAVAFFDAGRFNGAASLQDNILFGKLAYGQARGGERVGEIMAEVIRDLDLRPAVMEVGLGFHVGIGGGRLSGSQRQKLGIARAVLKRPDILVLNEATASLDGASQAAILSGVRAEFEGRGLVWAVHRPSMARGFDRVIVMRSGRVLEQGPVEELDREGTALHDLMGTE
ncbi:MAG: ABC transporter ATP-binding protein, partial [Rhodospirillaceae bacterium]